MNTETKKNLQAAAILVGTIVGVGTFGIPYVFAQAGFFVGLGHLAALSAVMLAIHLMYGEIVLRTQEKHRFIGYADIYLGTWGRRIAIPMVVVGIFGTLLAYTIVGGNFTALLFDPFVELSTVWWSLIFFAAMAFFIVTDFRTGAPAELLMNAVFLAVFTALIGRSLPDISAENIFAVHSTSNFFLPYGVVLFAVAGSAAVPELRDVLMGDGRMRRVIIWGTLIPVALYALFALAAVGVVGEATTPDAIGGLVARYGRWVAVAGGIVGALTTATSFIVLGLVLKHAFIYDLRVPKHISTMLVLGVPLLLFAVSTHDFVKVIGFVGAVFGGIEGILMLKLHRAAKILGRRSPEYSLHIPSFAYYIIGALYVAGIGYEIAYTFLHRA